MQTFYAQLNIPGFTYSDNCQAFNIGLAAETFHKRLTSFGFKKLIPFIRITFTEPNPLDKYISV